MTPIKASRHILALTAVFGMASASDARSEEIDISNYGVAMNGMPFAIVMDKGYFKECGLDITGIISSPGGGTTIRNHLAGDLLYSEPSLAAVVAAVQSGADIKIVSGNAHTVSDISWVTMPGSPIKALDDIKGKRLGFTNPGSTTQALTLLLLEKAGYTPDDVEMVATGGFGPGLTALESGGVDMMALTEPLLSRDVDKYEVVIRAKDVFPPMNNVIGVATTQAIETRPDDITCVITARRKAVEFMYDNPAEAAKIIAKAYEMDEAIIERAVMNLIEGSVDGIPYWGPGRLHYEGMDNMIRAQRMVGAVEGDVDWSQLVDESLLPEDLRSQ
jgi:NitT/TauT family transport system substrate-binding protein